MATSRCSALNADRLLLQDGSGNWINHVLEIFALFMLTGIFSTLLISETKGKTLEELSGEDQDNFIRPHGAPAA